MLAMENKSKKLRNPFPAVGKVFKYEMISIGRKILPIYAVLLALSLVIGLFVMDDNLDFEAEGQLGIVKTVIVMLTIILFSAMGVILISVIARRFKKSILGDEGYLNMTLPVTVGEHLWGRYLANLVSVLSYALVMFISILLILIRGWGKAPEVISQILAKSAEFKIEHGFGYGYIFWHSFIHVVSLFMFICIFIYMTESLLRLIGKHNTLVSVLTFALMFTIYHNIAQGLFKNMVIEYGFGNGLFWKWGLFNLGWIILFSLITRYILNNKLNLE